MNKQITLAARPKGFPKDSDFKLVETAILDPNEGEVLVRVTYLSVDPYMRGMMNEAGSGYAPAIPLGGVMAGGAVGQVIKSRDPRFQPGDYAEGRLGWQEYAIARSEDLRKIDPSIAPVSTALGVLGMPGLTAYFGLLEIAHPKAGETVVVSGAAGAVGSLAGQIAKIHGCRVVGIAGSDDKVRYVTRNLGFDAAFNYKSTSDYNAKLKEFCPNCIDVYFDNVGGPITDAVMRRINTRARISVCGQISQYNLEEPPQGPNYFMALLVRQARAEGFLVFQFAARYKEGIARMAQWLKEGKLKYHEDVVEGIERAPDAFIGMLRGENTGKRLVKVSNS